MFNFGRFTERKPKVLPKPQIINLFLVPPEDIVKLRGQSLTSYESWYKAIYLVRENLDIKSGTLATQIDVSWITADKMRVAIVEYFNSKRIG